MKENNEDRLKDFVDQNIDDFDMAIPPKMSFAKKAPEKKQKLIPISWLYSAAAVFMVIMAMGAFWVYNRIGNSEAETVVAEHQEEVKEDNFSLSEISEEMAELESYYNEQLKEKKNSINQLGYGEEIEDELAILDEEFNSLKNELGENVDNHLIVNEMIKNYKLKLDLLESVLNNLQENYDDKNLTNLDNDETYTVYY